MPTSAAAVGRFVLRGEDSRWPIAGAVALSAVSLVITAALVWAMASGA